MSASGYISAFDGLPVLSIPEYVPVVVNRPAVETSLTGLIGFIESTPETISDNVRDMIVSKAKLANRVVESLVKKYNNVFMSIYHASHRYIEKLENDLAKCMRPKKGYSTAVIDFTPRDAVVDDETKDLIMQALLEGKELSDLLPESD